MQKNLRNLMRIAVFCGSRQGSDPKHVEKTIELAQVMAIKKLNIVYGGGKVGLMGTLADTAIAAGVHIIGVIPDHLADKELAHTGVNELILVKSMHDRKTIMANLADGFIALPGGPGTLEEISEVWTWGQLGLHNKPCGFLNVNGYFDGLFTFFETMVTGGFMKQEYLDMLIISDDIIELFDKMAAYTPPKPKWTT